MKFTVRVAQVYHEVFNGIEAATPEEAIAKVEQNLLDGNAEGELIFSHSLETDEWNAYRECEGVRHGK